MSDIEFPPPIDSNYARPSLVLERSTEAPDMKGSVVSRLRQPIKVETFVNGVRSEGRVEPTPAPRYEKVLAPTISDEPVLAPGTVLVVPQTPVIQPVVQVPRVKVVLRGSSKDSKVGRMTIFCSAVAVSDSLVLIKYPADGQTTIVEPPSCGASDPLLVDYQGFTYKCMSDNWAVEVDGYYFVVLLRLPEAE